ncbi:DUF4062 domain-containing protein [Deinococcus planocerae]|uniref:DUF4062 domain-containing protein n=1 Tax=Deinococcus planocerae TaxID=1737569 RepID=UPI0011AED808|nr:DUF4062 domain-containing protein [Deinococcus planocerae]
MPFNAKAYNVVIASPSDVTEERDAVENTVLKWNTENAEHHKLIFLPVRWENNTLPEYGRRPQEVINSQIIRNSDILIGIFWTRLGSSTGRADSGTIEEMQEMLEAGKRVMLYFSSKRSDTDSIDADQYAAVKKFKTEASQKGLHDSFSTTSELIEKLRRHLDKLARSLDGYADVDGADTTVNRPNRDLSMIDLAIKNVGSLKYQFEIERDSEPINERQGKVILRKAKSILMSMHDVPPSDHSTARALRELLIAFTKMDEFGIYADGGESWRQFWVSGVEVLDESRKTLEELKKVA